MKTWSHYAFILDNTIFEISPFIGVGYETARRYAQYAYGDNCIFVDVTNYRMDITDTYRDGAFYYIDADGVEHKREPVPSEEDRIEAVESTSATNTSSIESNTTAIDDILVMLLDDNTDTTEV